MLLYGNIFYKNILSAIFCIRIWARVFKNGPSKICGRMPLKNLILVYLTGIWKIAPEKNCSLVRVRVWTKVRVSFRVGKNCPKTCLSRPYHFKFFKGCLLQILLGPFLNTSNHMFLCSGVSYSNCLYL